MKSKRLTAEEKEARDKEATERKRVREENQKAKAAEKAKREEDKALKAKEREEKRKAKEEEDKLKAQQKEETQKKKEEEQRRLQEEKEKKARAQPAISSFFKGASTPKKTEASGVAIKDESPEKAKFKATSPTPQQSEYRRRFKPFYQKRDVTLAPSVTRLDEETRNAKSSILDEYISGQREHTAKLRFDAVDLLSLSCHPQRRGRLHHPVKHIMEKVYEETERSTGHEEASKIMKEARQRLSAVPLKVIAFSRDVRPPYYGTITFKPFALGEGHMRRLARKPVGKRLPLDYDYDSEAEWQEEEGEDVDVDDDEEELDGEDDMDGFLDDSEDLGPSRRIFANGIEPDSTGICFETRGRMVSNLTVLDFAMEFIHGESSQCWMYWEIEKLTFVTERLERHEGIDPFSTSYWETEKKVKTSKAAVTIAEKSVMPPPPAPADAFAALTASSAPAPTGAPLKLVKDEILNDVKRAIVENKAMSKVGIVDFIFHKFREASISRAEVKNTLEYVAEKRGSGRTKEWELRDGHEIVEPMC
jgi:chromatin assembly factor 1 subunit A